MAFPAAWKSKKTITLFSSKAKAICGISREGRLKSVLQFTFGAFPLRNDELARTGNVTEKTQRTRKQYIFLVSKHKLLQWEHNYIKAHLNILKNIPLIVN